MMKSAVLLASLIVARAERIQCYIGGDPHVRTFDNPRGWTHHPVYAPGAWWLVNTESGDFQAQAMYSQCGRKTGGGWQGWKKHVNDSAHCLESIALSSKLIDHQALQVQPPCTWNWGQMKCDDCTADRLPRVTFNGEKIACSLNKWIQVTPGLSIHCRVNRAQIKLGEGEDQVSTVISFGGGAGFEPSPTKTCKAGTLASLHLWMNKGQFGPQCGHCGNADGDITNDKIFDRSGVMTEAKEALCDADVKDCHSLFRIAATPKRYNSNGHVIPEDDSLCGCAPESACKATGETRTNVQKACADAYQKVCKVEANPLAEVHKAFFEECMSDVCNGGIAFTDVDVEDEAEADCRENEAMQDDAVCNHCVFE